MRVLSLFDGHRCGYMALEKAGFTNFEYFASEVDAAAIKVADCIAPSAYNVGDVKTVNLSCLPAFDLLIGGSPCQGFSMSGKQLDFADPRSALFFEYLRILREILARNPSAKFLLENVRMRRETERAISTLLGVEPLRINSALVSAQRRPRLYWTNIPCDALPADEGKSVADILESDVRGYDVSQGQLKRLATSTDVLKGFSVINPDKAVCMTARQYANWKGTFVSSGATLRRLTPRECARLQTIPERHIDAMLSSGVPERELYKMLGNGWTVDVIAHILGGLHHV